MLAKEGNLDEAAARYEEALRLEPGRVDWQAELGDVYRGLGRIRDALNKFLLASEQEPETASYHRNAAVAMAELGRGDEAIEQLQEAVKLRPHRAIWRVELGGAFERSGQLERALDEYQMAIDLEPSNGDARLGGGRVLRQLGRSDEAGKQVLAAMELAPTSASSFHEYGLVLREQGDHERSLEYFSTARDRELENPDYAIGVGSTLRLMGRFGEAAAELEEVVAAMPRSPEARFELGQVYSDQGRWESAIAEFKHAAEMAEKNGAYHRHAGLLLLRVQTAPRSRGLVPQRSGHRTGAGRLAQRSWRGPAGDGALQRSVAVFWSGGGP